MSTLYQRVRTHKFNDASNGPSSPYRNHTTTPPLLVSSPPATHPSPHSGVFANHSPPSAPSQQPAALSLVPPPSPSRTHTTLPQAPIHPRRPANSSNDSPTPPPPATRAAFPHQRNPDRTSIDTSCPQPRRRLFTGPTEPPMFLENQVPTYTRSLRRGKGR